MLTFTSPHQVRASASVAFMVPGSESPGAQGPTPPGPDLGHLVPLSGPRPKVGDKVTSTKIMLL